MSAGRPDVRGGSPTRGFPPGSAQALVALVLGFVLFAVGLNRREIGLAVIFLIIGGWGALSLLRLLLKR